MTTTPLEDRLWPKIDAAGDCWQWTAAITDGYGRVKIGVGTDRREHQAHRVVWELLVGPIPDGLQLVHLCRNRACVNPDHLALVTRQALNPPVALADRLWSKVDAAGDCWQWTAAINKGYGRVKIGVGTDRREHQAHRVVWELLVGPIPDGLQLDHLCRNRACVNPDHLEPVAQRVNMLRGFGAGANNQRKTLCVNGHDLTDPDNVYIQSGRYGDQRQCRTCRESAGAARNAARRAQHAASKVATG